MKRIIVNFGILSLSVAEIVTLTSCNKSTMDKIVQTGTNLVNKSKAKSNLTPKISFWNVLNLGNDDTPKKSGRFKSIANVIKDSNSSVIGLAEIDEENTIEKLCNLLVGIDPSANWKWVRSKTKSGYDSNGQIVGGNGQLEYYGFLYKSSEFGVKEFVGTHSVGAIYINPRLNNELYSGERTAFVRPPFAVEFEEKTTHKDFTFVISHNDSPGTSASKGSIKEKNWGHAQGTQEIWEAKHLIDAMTYFDSIDDNNADFVYMGDTNIKSQNQNQPFEPLINGNYSAVVNTFDDSTKSSLGFTNYSEAYDRIFVKSSFKSTNNPYFRYDLEHVFSRNIAHTTDFGTSAPSGTIGFRIIRSFVSDHTMVSTNLTLSNNENDNSQPNWNNYLQNIN